MFYDYVDYILGGVLFEFGFVYYGERERGLGVDVVEMSFVCVYDVFDVCLCVFFVECVFGVFNVCISLMFEFLNVGGVYKFVFRGVACVSFEMWRVARVLVFLFECVFLVLLDDVLDEDIEI